MKNNQEQLKKYKCNLCERDILTDNGACPHCGWVQQLYLDRPNEIHWSYNFVSFNKAKELLKEGKPIKPDFSDFIECMGVYNELEFYYNGKHYGVLLINDIYHFYELNVMDKGYQEYSSIEEFAKNANVDGTLLKDIWNNVESVNVAS